MESNLLVDETAIASETRQVIRFSVPSSIFLDSWQLAKKTLPIAKVKLFGL